MNCSLLGSIKVNCVHRKTGNQGICTEALKQVVRFGFDELKIHKIACDTDSDNPASLRVLEKAGFKEEEVFEEAWHREDESVYEVDRFLINPGDHQNHETQKIR